MAARMCKDNHNHINNYEEKDDHDHSNDDEDEDGGGVWPQGCAADFLPALRIQIRCRAGRGPRGRKGITFLWNRIHKYRTGEIEKEKHTFPWNRIHNTNTHGTKNTKYVFESDVKHEQDCIHFFGLDYANTKTEESQ